MKELIERLRDVYSHDNPPTRFEAADALERLIAENAALRADAERYRWLREATTEELGAYAVVMPEDSDFYIDAAIAGEKHD